MKKIGDLRLMMKCCSLYYEDNLNQQEIANQLGISRPTISRILKEAFEQGIVKIQIVDVLKNDYQKIERSLERKYKLKEVIVVDDKQDSLTQKQELARAVSEYLTRVVKENDIIGVSIGTTLKEIPRYVEKNNCKNVTFIPLLGGIGDNEIDIHANQIAVSLARAFGGDFKLLHAPAVMSDLSTKEKLCKDEKIKEVLDLIDKTTIAIVGIGNPMSLNSTIMASGYMHEADIEDLKKYNSIGAICLQAFDKEGKTSILEFNQRVLGVKLEDLKKIKRTIGVASGDEKIEAIKASLKAKFINSLAINHSLAIKLLEDCD